MLRPGHRNKKCRHCGCDWTLDLFINSWSTRIYSASYWEDSV